MRRFILFLLFSSLLALPAFAIQQSKKISGVVLVSVLPQKFLIEQIANDTVRVIVIVPSGASPHSYEPTLKQVLATENADIWFRVGEVFENKIVRSLKRKVPIIDQRDGIQLLTTSHCKECNAEYDTHIWLSPKILEKMTQQAVQTLSSLFPENAELYQKNGNQLISDLKNLDDSLTAQLANKQDRFILVSHPAFGYFCRDYQLHQVSVEAEGREPSPQEAFNMLTFAKKEKIKKVLVQSQYHPKRAETIAKEIGAKSYMFDPYAENVIENLTKLGNILTDHE